jgi:hypothetical protein
MHITKICNDDASKDDCEITLNSGLFDVILKAKNIKEKIDWKNAFTKSQNLNIVSRYNQSNMNDSSSGYKSQRRQSF